MAYDDGEVIQEKPPSNTCCTALKKKNAKLLHKISRLEEIKNQFREFTALLKKKNQFLERENQSLKEGVEEQLQVQADEIKQLKKLLKRAADSTKMNADFEHK